MSEPSFIEESVINGNEEFFNYESCYLVRVFRVSTLVATIKITCHCGKFRFDIYEKSKVGDNTIASSGFNYDYFLAQEALDAAKRVVVKIFSNNQPQTKEI